MTRSCRCLGSQLPQRPPNQHSSPEWIQGLTPPSFSKHLHLHRCWQESWVLTLSAIEPLQERQIKKHLVFQRYRRLCRERIISGNKGTGVLFRVVEIYFFFKKKCRPQAIYMKWRDNMGTNLEEEPCHRKYKMCQNAAGSLWKNIHNTTKRVL